jgi:hypothetical protein
LSFAHRYAGSIRRYDPSVTLPAPGGSPTRPTPPTIDHPNRPGRGRSSFAFVAPSSPWARRRSWGIVSTAHRPSPGTVDTVPGTRVTPTRAAALIGGALVGAGIAAVGAGIVTGLVLRGRVSAGARIGPGPDPLNDQDPAEASRR